MRSSVLDIGITDGPLPIVLYIVSAIAVLYLVLRRPSARWVITALIGILGGAVIGAAIIMIVNALGLFGEAALPITADIWVIVTFAAVALAVVNLWSSRWWRKVIAVISIILFAITGTIGVNAVFGLNHTVGSLFGIVSGKPIDIHNNHNNSKDPTKPLYETWKPPADMPKTGKTGTQVIPNTASGFTSRPAGIYLPPAAQVKDAPALPLVIMMMGQPGVPDPAYVAPILDKMAAKNNGLAPIVIVADQLGNPSIDPLCLDTKKYGNAESFIMKDVVNWAKANLNVLHDRKYWTIAGYSNGGECAAYFGAKYPETFGNIGDLSGDEFQGMENDVATKADIFNGDQAAYDKVKPTSIFAANTGKYADTVGVFTAGSADPLFLASVKKVEAAAKAAGVSTTLYEVPGADHGQAAVDGGIQKLADVLYPRLGLSK